MFSNADRSVRELSRTSVEYRSYASNFLRS